MSTKDVGGESRLAAVLKLLKDKAALARLEEDFAVDLRTFDKEIRSAAVATLAPEAAQGLLQKALELKNPEIHILALEGVLAAHACFEEAIALDEMPVVEQLLESCFREGGGHRGEGGFVMAVSVG